MGTGLRSSPTAIAGVMSVETDHFEDARGRFARLYRESDLSDILGGRRVVQINHSRTEAAGTVRGLHFQMPPHSEMKFIRCLKGAVWDVAVDLREGSPTCLQWHAQELSADNGRMLVIPEGCAHGFQVLEPGSELLYLHTAAYCPEAEGAIHCQDPALRISWPLPVTGLSARDASHPPITSAFKGISQ